MATIEDDDFLLDAEDDLKAVEFIKAYLPQDVKPKFTDEELFYFLDALAEYYTTSGLLEQEPDKDGCIDIDTDAVAAAICKTAKKEHMGEFDPEDVVWIVQAELEYGEQE